MGLDAFQRNISYSKRVPDFNYYTKLSPPDEIGFRTWQIENDVPFQDSPDADYDMRGFYKALVNGDPKAKQSINPNDNRMHFPDYWKTPFHQSFSRESQWATDGAPTWNDKDQLVLPTGEIVFDERAKK